MLGRSRPIGFGTVGSIPFSEVAAYIKFRGFQNLDLQDDILEQIGFLDNEYLAHLNKKDELEKAKGKEK